jgi:maltose 6'-phosphate phosphatase
MKVLTFNLHLSQEENLDDNKERLSKYIIDNDIDVCLFQEVAQTAEFKEIEPNIKKDNYVLDLIHKLDFKGSKYYYYYDYGNRAYSSLDDGLAIISKYPLMNTESFYVSRETDYEYWWTRKIIKASIQYKNSLLDLISVHLGWTQHNEVFEDQLDELEKHINQDRHTILGGDFNVSSDSKEYDYISSKEWCDVYYNGDIKYQSDPTHLAYIDVKTIPKRIDYIFTSFPVKTINRDIVFQHKPISDHYGVFVEWKDEE